MCRGEFVPVRGGLYAHLYLCLAPDSHNARLVIDGHEGGEYAAIYYRRDRFRVVRSGRFWLSQSPLEIGSIGWDAALPRIATWAAFEDTTVKINTHFDHRGEEARLQSTRLIVEGADGLSPTDCVVEWGISIRYRVAKPGLFALITLEQRFGYTLRGGVSLDVSEGCKLFNTSVLRHI